MEVLLINAIRCFVIQMLGVLGWGEGKSSIFKASIPSHSVSDPSEPN